MDKIISIQDLTYQIPYSDTILENVNLELGPGSFIGLLGHNGIGKTTVLDLIMGFRATSKGKILVLGEDPYADSRTQKDKVIFLSQDVIIKGDLSVREYLDFHSKFYPAYSKDEEAKLTTIFEVNLDQKIGSLSTGQQKKAQFIAGLASMPKIIIVDEMTAVLDPIGRRIFFQQLKRFKNEYKCSIILATNIAEDLIGTVDKVLFLKDKNLIEINSDQISNFFEDKKAA